MRGKERDQGNVSVWSFLCEVVIGSEGQEVTPVTAEHKEMHCRHWPLLLPNIDSREWATLPTSHSYGKTFRTVD